ncbi:PREDICTED: uncharacterized protein LOC105147392 [Acromyrmex echinatior]|uniref:uncharacterized protein LOC105147392 n=1 Tax=Acromyrmex echinatior TaxID=103372 RepID=UPI000580E8DD|nr:PREDICTED: uncharacterized protein LOC105147392 [Acromyrmex echinatior]
MARGGTKQRVMFTFTFIEQLPYQHSRFVASRVCPGVPFKLSDSSYSPRAFILFIILFASVLRECPVREDVNPILRGGGDLGETSGIGGATLRIIVATLQI